jgi:hypothetical protein
MSAKRPASPPELSPKDCLRMSHNRISALCSKCGCHPDVLHSPLRLRDLFCPTCCPCCSPNGQEVKPEAAESAGMPR